MSGTVNGGDDASSLSVPFRFLRSLRDMLFGRRRGRLSGHDGLAASRVKSSHSLDDELRESRDNAASRIASAAATSSSSADLTGSRTRTRTPYNKLKSISTGDLLDANSDTEWLLKCTSPDSMERRVLLAGSAVPQDYNFTDLTRPSDYNRQAHSVSSIEDVSDQDFFSISWLERTCTNASELTGDVCEVVDNLDIVSCRQSLDVSLLKDRLAVRQKNKRHTTALQRKIDASRFTQGLHEEHRLMRTTVPECSDSDVTDKLVTSAGDRPRSRDGDVTSSSVQSRSYSDGGTESAASAGSASVTVTPRYPAIVATTAGGRGRPVITSSMLNDALRHVRPTTDRQTGSSDERRDDSALSSTGGRRLKARPVTMMPSAGTGCSGDLQDQLTRRTRDVTDDAE